MFGHFADDLAATSVRASMLTGLKSRLHFMSHRTLSFPVRVRSRMRPSHTTDEASYTPPAVARSTRSHVKFAEGTARATGRSLSESELRDWQPVRAKNAVNEAIKVFSGLDRVRSEPGQHVTSQRFGVCRSYPGRIWPANIITATCWLCSSRASYRAVR